MPILSLGTRPVLTLLALLVALPGPGLLALALRRRLPAAALPGVLMLLPAEAGDVVAAAGSGAPAALAAAAVGLVTLLAAVAHAVATAPTQLSPWWWRRFAAALARWEADRATALDARRP